MEKEHLLEGFLASLPDFSSPNVDREKLRAEREAVRAAFDAREYEREDLAWYRTAFLEGFVFPYDVNFYDPVSRRYRVEEFIEDGAREFGGYDLIVFWQPYPQIGIDNRNEFDCYRYLPGGLAGLRDVIERAHAKGVRVLLNYIPWDTGTRREDQSDAEAIADIVAETDADGVYLDTMGQVPDDFREALDRVRPGLVLETEAMPKLAAATVLTGAWAQTYAPFKRQVWANRWVEPRFSVRGVARELTDRRSLIAMGFAFGMGHVAWENIFGFWNPLQPADRTMIRRVVALLRANKDAFLDPEWEPILPTLHPGIFTNRWHAGHKTVHTLINLTGEAFQGRLLRLPWREDARYYDVWNGRELEPFIDRERGTVTLPVEMEPHDPGCIVELPSDAPCPVFAPATESHNAPYRRRVTLAACEPKPVERTSPAPPDEMPSGMVLIPSGRFIMNTAHGSHVGQGGCYDHLDFFGAPHETQYHWMAPLLMDRALVTNQEYREFLRSTGYRPQEMRHFLHHWTKPQGELSDPASWEPPTDKQDHPVVWVDLDDARAYARWAGKRLPTEEEWQYAAQGMDGRKWPWGNEDDPTRCNGDSADTTPVDRYPQGAGPFGCLDMAGNVWEWTESERNDGHNRFAILKGGSHYRAEGSMWYMAGGAQPCMCHLRMLLMYPGIDRHATIGFRCVKDVR